MKARHGRCPGILALGLSLLSLSPYGLAGCSQSRGDAAETTAAAAAGAPGAEPTEPRFVSNALFDKTPELFEPAGAGTKRGSKALPPAGPRARDVFFGDLHVHTTYSFDAFAFGTLATPSDAYRYAKGEAIAHPAGFEVKLREPLDFYAVTDHAGFLGVAAEAADPQRDFSRYPVAEVLHDLNAPDNMGMLSFLRRFKAFGSFLPDLVREVDAARIPAEETLAITRTAWRDTIEAAEQHNAPGRFTTFVAFEYTSSTDDRGNLHRNVVFEGSDKLPTVPFSRFHSQNPEDLWTWMDTLRGEGVEALAIPHNSNGSNGHMFEMADWSGAPLSREYGEQRLRNEPLVEITQVKGTSETHPALSTRDEWADFEITPYRVATMLPSQPEGSYVRDAYRRGLKLEAEGRFNPYRFGWIGSSDTHTGAISDDEANFFSKLGLLDATGELRGVVPLSWPFATVIRWAQPDMVTKVEGRRYLQAATPTYGASGLAAVWAEENTRASIYAAFRRKETYATSGPRIRLRFSGETQSGSAAVMGGAISARPGDSMTFRLEAVADPMAAPLARLQIVKGWSAGKETFEQVFDVACSDGGVVDPETHRCPPNGAQVSLSDCQISADVGDASLAATWTDPAFDADQPAFYYARVLENPTCRWSTWDALRAGTAPRSDLPKTIQERAWSSPISVRPAHAVAALGSAPEG